MPLGWSGVFDSLVHFQIFWCLKSCSLVLKGIHRVLLAWLAHTLFMCFLHWFQNSFSTRDSPLKAQNRDPRHPKIIKICIKIIIETRPQPRAEKRLRLGRAKPVKLTTLTPLSAVFPKAQRSQREAKNDAEIEASGTQNRQKLAKRPPSQTVENKTTKS